MFFNYIKIALRNLHKNRVFSLINILGLAIAMTACILILFWVHDELSFDKFHQNAEQIYQINKSYLIGTEEGYNSSTPFPLAAALRNHFSEVEEATHFMRTEALVRYADKSFTERSVCQTDESFFRVFSYPCQKGQLPSGFSDPNSIIITQAMAEKYFGDRDPIGEVLTLNNSTDYNVAAILKDIPPNSSYHYDFYVQFSPEELAANREDWGNQFLHTYALLRQNSSITDFNAKLAALAEEHLPEEKISFLSRPLSQVHLYSIDGRPEGLKNIYFFSIIALFILIIACINFTNLSTARSATRAKEVGMRKVIGADKKQIIWQFLGESVLQALIALIVALLLVELLIEPFNQITGKSISIDFMDLKILSLFLGTVLVTGVLAGLYPALFLASFKPIKTLSSSLNRNRQGKSGLRKFLVVTQFTIATVLLICTAVIYLQNNYIRHKDLGFQKENVLYIRLNEEITSVYEAFRNEISRNPDIFGVTRSSQIPTTMSAIARGIRWEGQESDKGVSFGFAGIDHDYCQTMGLKVIQGRDFSRQFPSDAAAVLINQKAAKLIGGPDLIGKQIEFGPGFSLPVLGVVQDFNALPLNQEIEPMVLTIYPSFYHFLLIRIDSQNLPATIRKIEETWENFSPAFPFEYHFLDESFDRIYRNEIRMGNLFSYFVVLAFFISCLGLLGLASYLALQRRKEIGIRKVQGASVSSIVTLLSREFAKWVLLSNLFAWPLAYFFMQKWLQGFAYRYELTPWPFLLSAVLTLVIALMTVSFQAFKAAIVDPVQVLRHE